MLVRKLTHHQSESLVLSGVFGSCIIHDISGLSIDELIFLSKLTFSAK